MRIIVAAVSCLFHHGSPDENLRQIDKWSRSAASEGADMVLFNETSATGYWMNVRLRELAEPLDGPIVQKLTEIAHAHNIIIAAGIMEADGDKQYNTHVIVGPDGLLGSHRKSSLPDGEEKYFDVGQDFNVFDISGIKFGVAICFESVHPETCRKLAENGAQVILAPYYNAVTALEIHNGKRPYFGGRARENGVWYIACDQCHIDNEKSDHPLTPGAVCFVDPSGNTVATTSLEETGEHMIVRELDFG